mgnify:CR=1 FL=1
MTKGERIKKMRERAGLTQEELAKKLNTTKQTIGKYEKNIVTNIPSNRIEKLAQVLDTTPEYILGWKTATEEDKKNSDILQDITLRMFNDKDFLSVVELLNELDADQLSRAKTMLGLLFDETHDEKK